MATGRRIVVTGAAGMLGTALLDELSRSHQVMATDLVAGARLPGVRWTNLDLLDSTSLCRFLSSQRPDVVVQAAAIVDVDRCEREPELAHRLHEGSTRVIADTIAAWQASLIYISSDSVFDGTKVGGYTEDDTPNPLNAYGKSKLAGEKVCLALPTGVALRTNIFGWSREEGRTSFAEWVLRGMIERTPLNMFRDVQFTPLHVSHLAKLVNLAIEAGASGLYHAGASNAMSKYDFALLMGKVFDLSVAEIRPRGVDDAEMPAPRARNMALDSARLRALLGDPLPTVKEGIELLRYQYDNGWLAAVKARPLAPGYRYWDYS